MNAAEGGSLFDGFAALSNHVVITKKKSDTIGLGRILVCPEGKFSCANEKLSLLDRQQKVSELTFSPTWPAPLIWRSALFRMTNN